MTRRTSGRCAGQPWVPVALLVLDVSRKLLADLAHTACSDQNQCRP
jgi:hypothetical protein